MDIYLLSMPFLSMDYSNVLDFENSESRGNYFNSRIRLTVKNVNLKYDSERPYVIIPYPVEDLREYDYMFFLDSKGKAYYYFITNNEMVTQNTTKLHLSLDVWTTNLFNYEILNSFVDRCHVPRWNGDFPTYNMEDEGIEIGEYIQKEHEDLYTMGKSIIVTSSVPMGVVNKSYGVGGSTGSTGSTGSISNGLSWQNGKLSSEGFRFIKGFEGFAPVKYQDSGGYWTIAYGVTKHGEESLYNELVSESPISEERAAKVSYELKNKNYGSKILSSVKNMGCSLQHQFDALCSLAYNCGTGVVNGSNSLTNAISKNPLDEDTIRPIWEKFYITSGGVQLPGLVARRKEECNMFFGKPFEKRSIALINSSGGISGTVTDNNGDGWLPDDENVGDINGYKIFTNEGGSFMCPVKGGTVTSLYGWRTHPVTGTRKFHHGHDIGLKTGSPTVACNDGVVLQAGWENPNNHNQGYGLRVWIQHGDYKVVYAHLSKINVEVGQTVKQGQKVGEIGSTGTSTGPHCHWEIRRISDNESINPTTSLKVGEVV